MPENRLEILIKDMNVTRAEFARRIGKSPQYLNQYLKGKKNIGNIFERSLRKAFPLVNIEWLKYGVGDMYLKSDSNLIVADSDNSYSFKIPVYGNVYCGYPAPLWDREYIKSFINLPDLNKFKYAFALIAQGDSMTPYINPKDYLICIDNPELIKDGKAVVIVFKGTVDYTDVNAKLIKFDKNRELITLYSINTKYPPQTYRESEILKIYKVIKIIRDVK